MVKIVHSLVLLFDLIVDSYKYRTRFTVNVDREILRKILAENLGMRKVSAEMVPQILSDDQKQW